MGRACAADVASKTVPVVKHPAEIKSGEIFFADKEVAHAHIAPHQVGYLVGVELKQQEHGVIGTPGVVLCKIGLPTYAVSGSAYSFFVLGHHVPFPFAEPPEKIGSEMLVKTVIGYRNHTFFG